MTRSGTPLEPAQSPARLPSRTQPALMDEERGEHGGSLGLMEEVIAIDKRIDHPDLRHDAGDARRIRAKLDGHRGGGTRRHAAPRPAAPQGRPAKSPPNPNYPLDSACELGLKSCQLSPSQRRRAVFASCVDALLPTLIGGDTHLALLGRTLTRAETLMRAGCAWCRQGADGTRSPRSWKAPCTGVAGVLAVVALGSELIAKRPVVPAKAMA